jgi:phage-related protein
MATPTLPLPPGITGVGLGSEMSTKAAVLKAQFGNNYTQRSGDGQNAISSTYQVSFANLTHEEAKVLIDFFVERKGYKAFAYTAPGATVAQLWTCEEWSREHISPLLDTVKATFIEAFTP